MVLDGRGIHGISIRNRLLVAFLLVFILVCGVLTTTFYFFNRDSISRYAREAVLRELESINETFNNVTKRTLTRELRALAINPLVDEYLMSSGTAREIKVRVLERLFLQTIDHVKGVERIRFVDSRGMETVIVDQKGRLREYGSIFESALFTKIEQSGPGGIAYGGFSSGPGGHRFSIGVHKIDPDIGEFGGSIIWDYNFETFFSFARSIRIFNANPVWIFSHANQILLEPPKKERFDPRPFPLPVSTESIRVYPHRGGLVAASDLAIIGDLPLLKVCISIPESILFQDIARVLRFLSLVFAVSFVIIVIVVFFVSRYLSLPLMGLAESVQKLSLDNFSQTVDIQATGEVGLVVDSINIMSRHLKETAVSKEYVDSIFHAMTNSLVVLDAGGLIRTVNTATLLLLGCRETELTGQPFSSIAPGTLCANIKKNPEIDKVETFYRTKNKDEIPVLFSSSEMRNTPGGSAIVCLAFDISDKKKIEQEKELLQDQLRQAHKMEAIGTLAGGIAHDFNNILSIILGYTDMAKAGAAPGSDLDNYLENVLKAGERAKKLVQQILAFSRQADMECIPLQPASLVNETIKMLRSSFPTTIEIHQDIASDTGLIFVDPTQVHQILMNLSTNAFHAMEEKGGLLEIRLTETEVSREDLVYEPDVRPGTFIELSVSDTGPGIPPKIKDKIFDPYFTTKEQGKGTGMGLSIVHGIVKSYNGFVRLNSVPGKGSSFHVFLPVNERKNQCGQTAVEKIPMGRERILLVDDEKAIADVEKDMLSKLGYDVSVQTSSLEALEFFKEQPHQFDLVITDQTMPRMTGTDLARRLMQIRPDIPIILCTGYSAITSEDQAKSMGIREFAFKPLLQKDIARLIRKVMDGDKKGAKYL